MEKRNKRSYIYSALIVLSIAFLLIAILVFTYMKGSGEPTYIDDAQTLNSGRTYNYLLLGKDRASGLTDVMMIASVDTKDKCASVIQIPRDTYARYRTGGYSKINGALSALGAKDLCRFLEENMCLSLDGYFVFSLDTFSKVVDTLGGVEIYLPSDIEYTDEYQGLSIDLHEGHQILDGKAAEQLVRYRSGYVRGDIGRMDAQKLFMSAFIRQVKSSLTPSSALNIARELWSDIETDVGFLELATVGFCCFDIEEENIRMVTIAGEDIRSSESGAWFYVLSKSSSENILRDLADAKISDGDFDKNGVFRNPSSPDFERIYLSDIEYRTRNSKEISENGIEIQKQ